MSRRTTTVTIAPDDPDNRDSGARFLLTEMPADQAERWATRALLALTNAGAEIPDDVMGAGMAGLAAFGVGALAKIRYQGDVEVLLAEMLECVKYVPRKGPATELLVGHDCQIQEVSTFLTLRKALFDLHLGFLKADAPPTSAAVVPVRRPRSA